MKKRFWSLRVGTDFTLGVKSEVFFKAAWGFADSAERRYTIFVWPWTHVRMTFLPRPRGYAYAQELRERYEAKVKEGSEVPAWTHSVCGDEKPFADDGRTGPSA